MCTSVGEKIVKEKGGDVTIERLLNSLSAVLVRVYRNKEKSVFNCSIGIAPY